MRPAPVEPLRVQGGRALYLRRFSRAWRLVEVPEGRPLDQGRYWCYETRLAAAAAAYVWDMQEGTEPVGWVWRGGAVAQ